MEETSRNQYRDSVGANKAFGATSSGIPDGEMGNPFRAYFGEPNGPMNWHSRDAYRADRRDLPHAYIGKNNFLREIVDGSIIGNRESWYTTLALPYLRNDNLNVSWSTWTFDAHVVGQVPHEGIPRMITSSEKSKSERVTRRGLGFVLEHDFWRNERGQRNYYYNILQIRDSVQVTNNYDVLVAILNADNNTRRQNMSMHAHSLDVSSYMQEEVNMYGIAQKDPRGLEVAVELMVERLNKLGVQPNLFIVPPRMRIYLSMISDFHSSYGSRGDRGVQTFEQGPSTAGILRGMTTVTTDTFSVYEQTTVPMDLMARNRDTGAYFCMNHDPSGISTPENYRSDHRSVMVYDEDVDGIVKISIREAVKNCHRFKNGKGDEVGDGALDTANHNILINKTPDNTRDMFVYKDTAGKPQLCKTWSQVEDEYMDRRVIQNIGKGLHAKYNKNAFKCLVDYGIDKESFPTSFNELLSDNETGKKLRTRVSAALAEFAEEPKKSLQPGKSEKLNAPIGSAIPVSKNKEVIKKLKKLKWSQTHYMHALGAVTQKAEFVEAWSVFLDQFLTRDKTTASNDEIETSYNNLTKTIEEGVADGEINAILVRMGVIPESKGFNFNESSTVMESNSTENNVKKATRDRRLTIGDAIEFLFSDTPGKNKYNDDDDDDDDDDSETMPSYIGSGSRWMQKRRTMNDSMAAILDGESMPISSSVPHATEFGVKKKFNDLYGADTELELPQLYELIFLASGISLKNINRMIDDDIMLPFNILCARPFIRHQMYSMVLMKGGYDTGATFIGHTNMILSDDGATKMHYGNYTFNSKAMVMNDKNITIAEDVMFAGYRGGNGTSFFNTKDVESLKKSRLAHFQGMNRKSIIAMMLPMTETRFNHHPIDITGWYHNEREFTLDRQHYTSSQFYSELLGYNNSVRRGMITNPLTQRFLSEDRGVNRILCQDQWQFWNGSGFNGFRRSRSHLGQNLYAGVRQVFDGSLTAIEKLNRVEAI